MTRGEGTMNPFKLGVMSEAFRLGVDGGIRKAAELGVQGVQIYALVTSHIGVVPEDRTHPIWRELQSVLGRLGEYGRKTGVTYAVETGPEPAVVLKALLDSVQGVGVNFDPANLVMVAGDDPVAGVRTLKEYIVHTHAKDGVMLRHVNPCEIYGNAETPAGDGPSYIEVLLGHGSVDFSGWLIALKEIGYGGFLTIEREVGDHPEEDIRIAIDFLKNTMRKL